MDELWLEVLSSSEEEIYSEEENWVEENNSSEKENQAKKLSSEEENSIEINCSAEENWSEEDESMEEYFIKQSCSKEYSTAEENYSKGYSSVEEYLIDSSLEENSSGEEYWLEQDEQIERNFIEEHGLVVEAEAVDKEICVVEILAVGNDNCGKTQLIKGAFGDHSSFKVENCDGRDEYTVYMSKNVHFYIVICDIMDTKFARKESFSKEAVTFFCYDVNDLESLVSLEETWIPTFYRENIGSSFLVGIKRDPKTKPTANIGINSQEQMSIQNKAQELCQQLHRARLVYCSTEVKSSMLNVFQSAIDKVYPMALR